MTINAYATENTFTLAVTSSWLLSNESTHLCVMKSEDIELNDICNDVTKPGATARYDDHVDDDATSANHVTATTSRGEELYHHFYHCYKGFDLNNIFSNQLSTSDVNKALFSSPRSINSFRQN